MGIQDRINEINKYIDKFADGRKVYCYTNGLIEKVLYGNAMINYFCLKLYQKPFHERRKYLSTRDAEKLEALNPANNKLLNDKESFDKLFSNELHRDYLFVAHGSFEDFERFCKKHPEFMVKTNYSNQGNGIYKYKIEETTDMKELYEKLAGEYVLVEEILQQHPKMSELNPSSVNTVRVATINHNNKITVVATALRMGMGGSTDNLHNGGIGCSVDSETGIVRSLGFDAEANDHLMHPLTGCILPGFQIPNWDQVISLVTESAAKIPQFIWVGWDVAVTENGAALIEGNHNQAIDLIQMGNKGLKPDIRKILKGEKI